MKAVREVLRADMKRKAAQAADIAPIDLNHLERQTFGDPSLQREVLGYFVTQAERFRDRIAGRTDDRAEAAHALLGSARGIGAPRVAAAACDLEKAALTGTADLSSEIDAVLTSLDEACAFIAGRLGQG